MQGEKTIILPQKKKNNLIKNIAKLDALSPLKVLCRGYSIATDDKGNVTFAVKTVAVDRDAFFEVQIGCPPGKSLKVKIQSSMEGSSDATDEDGKPTNSDAHFFGESALENVACGSAVCFTLDMAPVSFDSEPGIKQ